MLALICIFLLNLLLVKLASLHPFYISFIIMSLSQKLHSWKVAFAMSGVDVINPTVVTVLQLGILHGEHKWVTHSERFQCSYRKIKSKSVPSRFQFFLFCDCRGKKKLFVCLFFQHLQLTRFLCFFQNTIWTGEIASTGLLMISSEETYIITFYFLTIYVQHELTIHL